MKQKFVDAFMDVAERFAQLSSAKRLQVGAIIVKEDRIISIGYNGMPSGWTNVCEEHQTDSESSIFLVTKKEVIHAEAIVDGTGVSGTFYLQTTTSLGEGIGSARVTLNGFYSQVMVNEIG